MKASRLCQEHIGGTLTASLGGTSFTGELFRLEISPGYVVVSLRHPGKPDIFTHGWIEQALSPHSEVTLEEKN